MDLIENHWHEEVEGFHMFRLTKKLKLLKKHIKKLQWMNGDIFARVENLRSKLKDVQHEVAKFPFDSKKKEIAVATLEEFHEALNDEEKIKESLNKLVNLNQSDFIQGRNIQDNILLTQELLKGYNRKGGSKRCALKIDIAKAYDTVFTLIMAKNVDNSSDFKYHPGCKELKMTHLCFADDLLVIYHGSVESVKVIKDSIDEFSKVSGLEPNLSKSTIFFGNVNMGQQRNILNVMPFKVGRFPVKYLRVPLITKRLGRGECKQLIDKVRNKVDDWKNKSLSYAGRIQLIASILNSMQVYWACVFLLPKTAVKDIKRILKGFLWCHGDLTRGKAMIAWKTLCKPKCQGGLGFKDLGMWNEVLLTRHIWNIAVNKESVWVKWVHIVKLKAKQHIEYIVGNGKRILAWYDKWNKMGPLCQIIDSRDLYNARYDKKATVADMIHNNQWRWKDELNNVFPELNNIQVPTLSEDQDKSMWRCSNGELKHHTFVLWMAIHGRLQTQDRVFLWKNDTSMRCFLCKQSMDSHGHLFVQCNYVVEVWQNVKVIGYVSQLKQNWEDTVCAMSANHCNAIKSVVCRIVLSAVIYFIWRERNKRQFSMETRPAKVLFDIILDTVRTRLRSLKVKNSTNIQKVAKDWGITFKNRIVGTGTKNSM
ncbi:RNA-directed DNA polymerase, eukaryota, reverse transcriptase zinc-binding domain protein [Tanacetum coccineum]